MNETEQQDNFTVNLIISQKKDKSCLEIRRTTTDENVIKTILSCAFHDKPIVVYPTFTNKIQSINTLQKKGIIYKEGENYYFTI